MTSSEATIVLAYRANVSIKEIAFITGITRSVVEAVLMATPHSEMNTADVLKALVAS